jgi:hypothetical protein
MSNTIWSGIIKRKSRENTQKIFGMHPEFLQYRMKSAVQ